MAITLSWPPRKGCISTGSSTCHATDIEREREGSEGTSHEGAPRSSREKGESEAITCEVGRAVGEATAQLWMTMKGAGWRARWASKRSHIFELVGLMLEAQTAGLQLGLEALVVDPHGGQAVLVTLLEMDAAPREAPLLLDPCDRVQHRNERHRDSRGEHRGR